VLYKSTVPPVDVTWSERTSFESKCTPKNTHFQSCSVLCCPVHLAAYRLILQGVLINWHLIFSRLLIENYSLLKYFSIVVSCSPKFQICFHTSIIVLMMDAVSTSEMSAIFYETTHHSIPEGCHFQSSLTIHRFRINYESEQTSSLGSFKY
jgi:hypothetical protein